MCGFMSSGVPVGTVRVRGRLRACVSPMGERCLPKFFGANGKRCNRNSQFLKVIIPTAQLMTGGCGGTPFRIVTRLLRSR